MRPGVKLSLQHDKKPTNLSTVFAGVDTDAVAQARKYFLPVMKFLFQLKKLKKYNY